MKHIQRQQFSFTKTSIKVSLNILVKPASRCLHFSKMNSKQENHSKLSFTARIIIKYSLERFLSICGEKMSKGFLKFCTKLMYRSNRSFNIPPSGQPPLGHLTFLKIIVQILPYRGQNAVQMPHSRVRSGDQIYPPWGHFTGT